MQLQMPIPSIPNQTTPETEASGKGKPDSATSDDIKKFSLTPFITELLNPTAKYLGEELKTFVKSKIEEKKKAVRGENLRLHLEALQDKDKADGKPLDFEEISDLEFFDAWTEGAQDAPKSEPELFELWQSILHGVIDRKISEKYIIDKAKELSPADARLIGSVGIFGTRAANKDRHATLQRLESLGFLNRNYLALWIPAFIFSLPLLVFSSRGLLTGDDGLGLLLLSGGMSVLFFWGEIALGYLLFFTIIAIYPLIRGGSIASWHLSPLGKILVNLSTGKELVKGKKYLVLFHPTLSYEAVKVGISFPALFLGPIWVLVNKLWKVLSWQIGFILLYAFIFSDLNMKALPLSLRYSLALASKVSGPLLFLVLWILPFVKGNEWKVRRLHRNGFEYRGSTRAETKLSAIAVVKNRIDRVERSVA